MYFLERDGNEWIESLAIHNTHAFGNVTWSMYSLSIHVLFIRIEYKQWNRLFWTCRIVLVYHISLLEPNAPHPVRNSAFRYFKFNSTNIYGSWRRCCETIDNIGLKENCSKQFKDSE